MAVPDLVYKLNRHNEQDLSHSNIEIAIDSKLTSLGFITVTSPKKRMAYENAIHGSSEYIPAEIFEEVQGLFLFRYWKMKFLIFPIWNGGI